MYIEGVEGLTSEQIRKELDRGARFIVYPYCISAIVVSFKSTSVIYFLRPEQSRVLRGLPYTLISAVLGWWGIPHGPLYTAQSIAINFRGGIDVTDTVLKDALADVDSNTALQTD